MRPSPQLLLLVGDAGTTTNCDVDEVVAPGARRRERRAVDVVEAERERDPVRLEAVERRQDPLAAVQRARPSASGRMHGGAPGTSTGTTRLASDGTSATSIRKTPPMAISSRWGTLDRGSGSRIAGAGVAFRSYHPEAMAAPIDVFLEVAPKRTFAVAVDWPGWTRAGRDEDAALDALLRAGPRYAAALEAAGIPFAPPADGSDLVVVERAPGGSGTEFGVVSLPLPDDAVPVDEAELARLVAILRAAWVAFDDAAARHATDELRKGPRGGGRDLPKIVAHVREADEAYLHQLGRRPPKEDGGPAPLAVTREATVETLRARALGRPIADPTRVAKPWTPRYHVRRAAWHALDHAWEIEDRAIVAGSAAR